MPGPADIICGKGEVAGSSQAANDGRKGGKLDAIYAQGGVTGNALPHSIQVDPGVGEAAVVFERLPF